MGKEQCQNNDYEACVRVCLFNGRMIELNSIINTVRLYLDLSEIWDCNPEVYEKTICAANKLKIDRAVEAGWANVTHNN